MLQLTVVACLPALFIEMCTLNSRTGLDQIGPHDRIGHSYLGCLHLPTERERAVESTTERKGAPESPLNHPALIQERG